MLLLLHDHLDKEFKETCQGFLVLGDLLGAGLAGLTLENLIDELFYFLVLSF